MVVVWNFLIVVYFIFVGFVLIRVREKDGGRKWAIEENVNRERSSFKGEIKATEREGWRNL